MMHYRTFFLSVFVLFVFASLPLIRSVGAFPEMWSQTYGGKYDERAYSLVEMSDGGYALAGGSLLVKTDAYGVMEWNRTYQVSASSLIVTADGGFALAGGAILLKLDAYGNVEWNQTYSGSISSLVETSDGGYALAGGTDSFGAGEDDFWLVKTDQYGNVEWIQTYGGAENDLAYSMVITSDGGFALCGVTRSFDARIWLVKTDAYGNMEWNHTYVGVEAYVLVETSDGGYAFAGYTGSTNFGGNSDFWLVKTDAYGNMLLNRTYNRNLLERAESLVETSDGGYALAGVTYSSSVYEDFWLVKTDQYGNMEWNKTYGGEYSDWAYSLVETSDGGYALGGYTRSFGAGEDDFWLVKTDEYGVVPEFPSWTILPLLIIAALVTITCKKRLPRIPSN